MESLTLLGTLHIPIKIVNSLRINSKAKSESRLKPTELVSARLGTKRIASEFILRPFSVNCKLLLKGALLTSKSSAIFAGFNYT